MRRHGLSYETELVPAQDYAFCSRLLAHGEAVNTEWPLVRYRRHPDQTSVARYGEMLACSYRISQLNLASLGIQVSLDEARRLRGFFYEPPLALDESHRLLVSILFDALGAFRSRPGLDEDVLQGIGRDLIDTVLARTRRRGLGALRESGLLARMVELDGLWVASSPPRWLGRRLRRALTGAGRADAARQAAAAAAAADMRAVPLRAPSSGAGVRRAPHGGARPRSDPAAQSR